jgi:hypothetical protein
MTLKLGKWTNAECVGPSPSGKTVVWQIAAAADGCDLGEVRWFSHWRQYVFAPKAGTVWNPDCLDEVSHFTRTITAAHRAGLVLGGTRNEGATL